MARSTWGSIRQKSKGVWEIRYNLTTASGRKQKSETVRGTKKIVEQRLAELRVEHEGTSVDMTLDQLWRHRYWPACEDLAPATRVGYENAYNYAIKPVFGDVPVRSIGPKAIQAWLNDMTYGAARSNRAVLRAILSFAQTEELVELNAAMARFRLPKRKPENMARQVNKDTYTKEELDEIFGECEGEVFEAPFILAAFGSAMREEACGVRPDEVEFEEVEDVGFFAFAPIQRGVQHLKGEVIVVDTKNDERKRWLVIPPPYATRLQELCENASEDGWEWLIEDGFGNLLSPNTMAMAYKRWFLGKPYKYVPFMNLRNSYATVMHALGLDLEMIQKMMGHKQLSTTFEHYDRPGREEFKQAIISAMKENSCGILWDFIPQAKEKATTSKL